MNLFLVASINGGSLIIDQSTIGEVEAELAQDKARLEEVCPQKDTISHAINRCFSAVAIGIRLRSEIEGLSDRIFKNRLLLPSVVRHK
jgi:hypothetical protein